jgi:hypothetical protein
MKVRLNSILDKQNKGFYDFEKNKAIAPKKFGKREVFEVEESHFIREKIRTGELEVVEAGSKTAASSAPDSSAGAEGQPTDVELNAAREAVAQAEAALEKAKADIKNAEDATQKSLCKDAIENAGQALGNAKAELKRLGKLAK